MVDNRTGLTPWTLTRWCDQHTSDKVAHYSIYRPQKDERLSWPSWLTYSGRLIHIIYVVTRQLQVERGTGKVRRSKTGVLPTVPRSQPSLAAALPFGRYSCPVSLRVGSWVGLSGWLHINMIAIVRYQLVRTRIYYKLYWEMLANLICLVKLFAFLSLFIAFVLFFFSTVFGQ